ncbi:lysylphosphatidylglycerol synthase transmembrane domain-containing protein [Rhodococcus sp. NM-2]|uniref:YbhN family protein n=1 Tax=Rhodococcus jostii TaxID=132919 RepID=A0ABU4CK50_RHOJO|nr:MULTISPECIES: YbhN family protein [Rhodococcus]MDI9948526.1 YbhN family protein [Rhodococcus sp. IEGM 1305]MDI9972550.1 YbhN family protein [Rhodococcus sp. IEGM 1307]MDV6283941.1 YbhN family protein [Rhodococcus jostii]
MAQPRSDPPTAEPPRQRSRYWWIKWLLGAGLLALLTVEGIYLWPTLSDSWKALTEIHWGWVAACIAAQAVSLSGYGAVQQRLLQAGGVVVSQLKSVSVIYASTAMAVSLPAGQVFSTAFTYKQTRKWGATPIVASWQLAISGVIAAGSLALLGAAGAFAVGTKVSPVTLALSLVAAFALFYGLRYISRNPDSIESIGHWVLTRYNKFRKNPPETGVERWKEILSQLDSVELSRKDSVITFGWSAVHRLADVACLGFACWAVGAEPSFAGLLIAFAAAKAVGSIPLAPGGLGFVDGTLIATLTAAGATASQALAAVFVYRVVSYILVAIVGWVVFFILFRHNQHEDLEMDLEFERREQSSPTTKRTKHTGDPEPDSQP